MRPLTKTAVLFLMILSFGFAVAFNAGAFVVREGDSVYIVDRMSERWDVSQAMSIGFDPRGFQYGIGRDSIRPLDGSSLDDNVLGADSQTRVIGVENGPDAHAYVVRKLIRHEIANTHLGEVPIAAAY